MGGAKSHGTHQLICHFPDPRGNMPAQLVKPVNELTDFPDVIGAFYQRIYEKISQGVLNSSNLVKDRTLTYRNKER